MSYEPNTKKELPKDRKQTTELHIVKNYIGWRKVKALTLYITTHLVSRNSEEVKSRISRKILSQQKASCSAGERNSHDSLGKY